MIIEQKTPSLNWFVIHKNVDEDFVKDFLEAMASGGYDNSGTDGNLDLEKLIAQHYDGGDLIQFRAY